MLDKFKSSFREEAEELLGQLESTLLELEDSPSDAELLNAAFRAIHTIKGSAGMFGFDEIARFTHDLENVLDKARAGKIAISREFIDLALRGRDHIRGLLSSGDELTEDLRRTTDALVEECRALAAETEARNEASPGSPGAAAPEQPASGAPGAASEGKRTFYIRFQPGPDIFRNGTRVLSLLADLAELGEATLVPHVHDIPRLSEMDPERCYCYWEGYLTTESDRNAIRDVFIFVESESSLTIEEIEETRINDSRTKRLGELLVQYQHVPPEEISKALSSQKRLGEILVEKGIISKDALDTTLAGQNHAKKIQDKAAEAGGALASVRVASEKLDQLVDLVGELVTLQARLARTSLDLKEISLAAISEQFERLIAQLRDNTMSIRMLPIGSTFNKFRRVVRDLSTELGKEADLLTEGADTELDKTVIERLNDPLVHIIRNSLDHGIESPQDREAAGKNRKGTILLKAQHSGAHVLISVRDDGAGLNAEAIRAKAVERGIVAPGQELTEAEINQLIFHPGFSTAKSVTKVSGRGVGMDVVKREIDSLGGTVMISTERGRGTEMTLKIPLTLAIIEGLLVAVGGEYYVVPLSSVDGCIEIPKEDLRKVGERRIIPYRGDLLPFVDLRSYFEVPGETPDIAQIVIANAQDSRLGFVVDNVIGDYQTVIKPLGRMYKDVSGISGATILGDGTVALILDVNRLSQAVQAESQRKVQAG
ncbi:MAG TPA: chemotaxis protein CheA [Spirochaetia bacterium]|nr:chemotaxis protein CheA [Spirochaetales bacterium]HRY80142.1 chemotaxis protein CheA [Spirochaetia bacterium]